MAVPIAASIDSNRIHSVGALWSKPSYCFLMSGQRSTTSTAGRPASPPHRFWIISRRDKRIETTEWAYNRWQQPPIDRYFRNTFKLLAELWLWLLIVIETTSFSSIFNWIRQKSSKWGKIKLNFEVEVIFRIETFGIDWTRCQNVKFFKYLHLKSTKLVKVGVKMPFFKSWGIFSNWNIWNWLD